MTQRICTLIEDREVTGQFRVAYIDDDGACELALFHGPDALDRAIIYASGKDSPYDGWNDPQDLGGQSDG